MTPTYYDVEKLVRMVYHQKLSSSLKKDEIKRSETRSIAPAQEPMTCRIRPSGATAK